MEIDLTGLAINRSLNESIDIVYNLNHNELVHLTGEPLRLSPAGDYVVSYLKQHQHRKIANGKKKRWRIFKIHNSRH